VIKDLPGSDMEVCNRRQVKVAILGRPNAGKSSLINRILGMDRLLVSDLPGTTRDTVDTIFSYGGKEYLLIDTAGIRRRGKVKEKIEKISMIKAIKSLNRCDVAVILIDALEGIAEQDARISGYALDRGRGVVLGINKWDLVKKDTRKRGLLDDAIDRQLKLLSFAPRVNISALTGERVMRLFEKIDLVYSHFSTRIATPNLNRFLQKVVEKHLPPRSGRGRLKFFYATQAGIKPPTFVLFVNRPDLVHFSYERFLINQIRENFGLAFTPIKLIFKKK
jgi:GTP-binding protein